nr:MAG TPA: hypothetical protein [Caudoviricetes sp.]
MLELLNYVITVHKYVYIISILLIVVVLGYIFFNRR